MTTFELVDTIEGHENPVCTLGIVNGLIFSGSLKAIRVGCDTLTAFATKTVHSYTCTYVDMGRADARTNRRTGRYADAHVVIKEVTCMQGSITGSAL